MTDTLSFGQRVVAVQTQLKAPKSRKNDYSGYAYRNAEDIYNAAKPLCGANELILTVSDDIIAVGERVFVQATATVIDAFDPTVSISVMGYAEHADAKKGLDPSQITGLTSSYARKYALGGLFALDDSKDADSNEYATEIRRRLNSKLKLAGVSTPADFQAIMAKHMPDVSVKSSKDLDTNQISILLGKMETTDSPF